MRSSLIITTYEWPEALECCLRSVLAQKTLPGEVLIADDGSGDATARLIRFYAEQFPVPLRHIWQPDEGFRLGMIRNKAIAAASGEYIIQTDGDILLHPHFVRDHLLASRPRHFIGGSRVLLSPGLTEQLLRNRQFRVSLFRSGTLNRINGIRFPIAGRLIGRLRRERGLYNLRGCNMSFWKSDLLAVNGYNEAISGWGREDTELVIRLYNRGLQRLFFKFRGIAYHLYHKEFDRKSLSLNDRILRETIRSRLVRCEQGIHQHLPAGFQTSF